MDMSQSPSHDLVGGISPARTGTNNITQHQPLTNNTFLEPKNHKSGNNNTSLLLVTPWTPVQAGSIRWPILIAICFVMFGNYFAFDNPAVLNKPLQEYMSMADDRFTYFLNLLYTTYSIPNIILPWLGGYAIDRFGHNKLLVALSAFVVLGQLVVCLGLERRNIGVMIAGRVIFGSAESLAVAQSAITVKYFQGKELAMALGINLCVGRMGGVLNDLVTPIIWSKTSVPFAFWCGLIFCMSSLLAAIILVAMDLRHGTEVSMENVSRTHRRPSSCLVDARLSFDGLTRATLSSKHDYPPSIYDIALEQFNGCCHPDEAHCRHYAEAGTTFQKSVPEICSFFDYSLSFWILLLMGFLLVGIIIPFNSIHAGFLQMRWYPGEPLKAAQIMTVPDLLSGLLILPLGYFVDHYGQRSWFFILCGLITGTAHVFLGLVKIKDPLPCLISLGVASAIGAIISSAVPILVRKDQVATAYGILTSVYNLSYVIIPMAVAKLMTLDPSIYTYTEIFFASIAFTGVLLATWLKLLDRNGDLDRCGIDK